MTCSFNKSDFNSVNSTVPPACAPLWVLGMHRSGTSFCVRALQNHGVLLPPNLLPPAADNPYGFQESADLVALNEALLAAEGCQWDGVWPLTTTNEDSAQCLKAGLHREARRLLESWCTLDSQQPMALKDPRLCRTLPQLSIALPAAWFNHGVAIIRRPASVVASIGYRDDMPPLKALALWMRYNLELVEARELHSAIQNWPILRFEELIENPIAELEPAIEILCQGKLTISLKPQHVLHLHEVAPVPSHLADVPDEWLQVANNFHGSIRYASRIGDIKEADLQPVRQLLDGSTAFNQQLLALEARRRQQLGQKLAEERRRSDDPGLLGEDDLQSFYSPSSREGPAYVQLDQVCIDLRGRDRRRLLPSLLRPQSPTGLRTLALDHLDLCIGHGERIGLLGHNGSGKTSLLRLLGGIYTPTSGRILRSGPPLAPVIEQSIGFSLELTGLQLVRFSHLLHSRYSQSWEDYLHQIKTFTELGDSLLTPIKTWSLGMRTRLSFALITFRDVQGLALDEGLAAGDQWFQRKARGHLDRFIDSAGTIVLASHSEDLLRRYCTRGVILERGRIRYDGSLYRALQLYRGQLN